MKTLLLNYIYFFHTKLGSISKGIVPPNEKKEKKKKQRDQSDKKH